MLDLYDIISDVRSSISAKTTFRLRGAGYGVRFHAVEMGRDRVREVRLDWRRSGLATKRWFPAAVVRGQNKHWPVMAL